MQKQHQPIDPLREIIRLEPANGFVDRISPQNVVDIGLHAGIKQELDRPQRVIVAIPADSHRTTVALGKLCHFPVQTIAGGGEVGDNAIFSTGCQDLSVIFVLVWVPPASQGKLVDLAFALPGDLKEVLQQHVRFFNGQTALVAANPGFQTQPGFAVNAVPHDANIDQMRKRRHKWVHTAIQSVFINDPGAHVGARFGQ